MPISTIAPSDHHHHTHTTFILDNAHDVTPLPVLSLLGVDVGGVCWEHLLSISNQACYKGPALLPDSARLFRLPDVPAVEDSGIPAPGSSLLHCLSCLNKPLFPFCIFALVLSLFLGSTPVVHNT
ncbi:hypothetical protein NL108_002849 [Boleophthalmus pectinirostris]|nr:hypothetical protein NL108_002849 [Boleophthalmus pectinirostris]